MNNSQIQPDPSVLNAINNYYRLKNQYETNKQKLIKKIMSNPEDSIKEKRRKAQQLKMNCIGCKRKVDTIFTTKNKTLKAVCGDKTKKCGLNIEISVGESIDVRSIIENLSADMEKLNQSMVRNKLDVLFGYINEDDAVAKFETLQEEILENKTGIETSKSVDLEYTSVNTEEVDRYKSEIYGLITNIKSMIKEYLESERQQLIVDVIELYQNDLIPKINELNELMYKCMNIIVDDSTPPVYKLNELPFSLASPEYIMSQSKVISNTKK